MAKMAKVVQFDPDLQPEWGGLEDCTEVENPAQFLEELLSEETQQSLLTRGYAVIKLPPFIMLTYHRFSTALDAFCAQDINVKTHFATKMRDSVDAKYTPNQYHGYSRMEGLKEQYMIRGCGKGTHLTFPGSYINDGKVSPHFGKQALLLFEFLDDICRKVLYQVAESLHLPAARVDAILDPVVSSGRVPEKGLEDPNHVTVRKVSEDSYECSSNYFYPKYISSSLLDVFHYSNSFEHNDEADSKFKNNHLSHSDSGILTLVPCADVAGLEVLDQKLNKWIALEEVIHTATRRGDPLGHRLYATIFWGDSYEYLTRNAKACMHRVARSNLPRHSIVYKMRTKPTVTAPRYQEDYELADIQHFSMKMRKQREYAKRYSLSLAVAGAALFLYSYWKGR